VYHLHHLLTLLLLPPLLLHPLRPLPPLLQQQPAWPLSRPEPPAQTWLHRLLHQMPKIWRDLPDLPCNL
jgi:hypothetical protein